MRQVRFLPADFLLLRQLVKYRENNQYVDIDRLGGCWMDNTDKHIIEILKRDGRATLSDIGARIKMSVCGTSLRLKKLEDSGVITGYSAVLDYGVMDKSICAHVYVTFGKAHNIDAFVSAIKSHEGVDGFFMSAGTYDYLISVNLADTNELANFVSMVRDMPGVVRVSAGVVLRRIV